MVHYPRLEIQDRFDGGPGTIGAGRSVRQEQLLTRRESVSGGTHLPASAEISGLQRRFGQSTAAPSVPQTAGEYVENLKTVFPVQVACPLRSVAIEALYMCVCAESSCLALRSAVFIRPGNGHPKARARRCCPELSFSRSDSTAPRPKLLPE